MKINNSTFTMVQGLVDGRIKTVELNTEILDKSDLIELAGYSFNELPNSNQALTNEDPNVYSLKLKR